MQEVVVSGVPTDYGDERSRLNVGRGLTDHENGAAPVEPGPVGVLPDILDLVRVPPNEPFCEVLVRAFDRLGMAFERAFAPPDDAQLCFDSDEEPAREHPEDLFEVLKRRLILWGSA